MSRDESSLLDSLVTNLPVEETERVRQAINASNHDGDPVSANPAERARSRRRSRQAAALRAQG